MEISQHEQIIEAVIALSFVMLRIARQCLSNRILRICFSLASTRILNGDKTCTMSYLE